MPHHRIPSRALRVDLPCGPVAMGLWGINLLWSLALVWASFGVIGALVLAVFLDYLITRLDHHLNRAALRGRGPPPDRWL